MVACRFGRKGVHVQVVSSKTLVYKEGKGFENGWQRVRIRSMTKEKGKGSIIQVPQ